MFKEGDLVFHARHGAGIIDRIQTMNVAGAEVRYYSINLATNDRLLIPVKQQGKARLSAFTKPQQITKALSETPQELPSDYRQRALDVEAKITSGDPLQVAAALRDLVWRQHTAHLSSGDARLKDKAYRVLANALAMKPSLDVRAASRLLDSLLQKMIGAWESAS